MIRIGLYSPNPQSGKTTTANYLKSKYDFNSVILAKPLKRMVCVFLEELGYDDKTIQRMIYGDLKEVLIPEVKQTPRQLMITLGTEWGRREVGENVWIDMAIKKLNPKLSYVSDDIRYLNEAEAFRKSDFKIIRVFNPRALKVNSISEGNLESYSFDYLINNDGSFEDLYSKIDKIVEEL